MENYSIYGSGNGGKLYIHTNDIQKSGGLGVMVYLKLFGGNVEASTVKENVLGEFRNDWWGNSIEPNSEKWINSQTERTLKGISLTPAAIVEIEEAIHKDLKLLEKYGSINVDVTFPGSNRIKILITINQTSEESQIVVVWDNTMNEVIEQRII